MPNRPPNFWNFSLSLYDREGVASACLELQARYRFDVNLILLCYWYGGCYGKLDDRLLKHIFSFSDQWRERVVQPMRDSRSWMKEQAERGESLDILRERVKQTELAAEKYQQERIELMVTENNSAAEGTPGNAASTHNAGLLLRAMGLDWNEYIEQRFAVISNATEQSGVDSRQTNDVEGKSLGKSDSR